MPAKASLEAIKRLREKTGAPVGAVRKALEAAGGDEPKALVILKQQGAQLADKRQDRATNQGRVEAYVHHNAQMGALVEIGCETDFVARTTDFVQLCKDLALHVAATGPKYLRPDDVPADAGLSEADRQALCLLEQPFVKDQSHSVGDLLKMLTGKTSEKIIIKRFAKFAVGEAAAS